MSDFRAQIFRLNQDEINDFNSYEYRKGFNHARHASAAIAAKADQAIAARDQRIANLEWALGSLLLMVDDDENALSDETRRGIENALANPEPYHTGE